MTVDEIKKIIEAKKSERIQWNTLWQDIGDFIFTRKNNIIVKRLEGEDKQVTLFDNTGPRSMELFAGVMMSILMSVEEQWFEHSSGDQELDNKEHIRSYLQYVTRTVHNVLANSNFYNEGHEMLLDLASFGTSIFGIEEDEEDVVRFFAKFIAEGYIGEDARGKVDELYMEYGYTARQIQKEYPNATLPDAVKKALEKNEEKKFKVSVCIYPVDRNSRKPNGKGHMYYAHHVMTEEKAELRLSGFTSFPYPTPRFSKATGETYGRSPAMVALPEVKVLNKMVEITLIGAEKVIDPPLQAPDDGFMTQLNTFPAGVSYYRSGSTDRIEPILNGAQIDFGIQLIQEKQMKVQEAFWIDKIMMKPKTGNPVTATERTQEAEQSARFMGPFMARMQKEMLQPTIDRVTEICFKRGILNPKEIPAELQGKKFTVKYTSFIARAQRVGTIQNIMRWFSAIEPLAAVDPTVKMRINGDAGTKLIAGLLDIPAELLQSDEVFATLKKQALEQQQAMMQQQQQSQQMDTVAKAAQATKQSQQG